MSVRDEIQDKILALQEEIRMTPYHKGTEHHIGILRAKIAKHKDEIAEMDSPKSGGGGGGFAVRKRGDATCVLIGPPSVGKSTLINQLANTESKTGGYDFTTTTVIPGMMFYQGAMIQIFDLPGLIKGAASGSGEGRKIIAAAKSADLAILMTDINKLDSVEATKAELYEAGFRLDEVKPKVEVKKTMRGGIRVIDAFRSFDKTLVKEMAAEFGVKNAEIIFKERIRSIDRLVDAFCRSRVYMPALYVINKSDLSSNRNIPGIENFLYISAKNGLGIKELREEIWEKLNLIRIYLKRDKSMAADKDEPMVVKSGITAQGIAEKISEDFALQVSTALIWGKSARFPGQQVSLSHVLVDGDEIYFEKKI